MCFKNVFQSNLLFDPLTSICLTICQPFTQYLRSQRLIFGKNAPVCCKRSSTPNLIFRYHRSISAWTTLSTFCRIFFTALQTWGHYFFTRKLVNQGFQTYLSQKECKGCLNAYILYQQPIIMFCHDLIIIMTCIIV